MDCQLGKKEGHMACRVSFGDLDTVRRSALNLFKFHCSMHSAGDIFWSQIRAHSAPRQTRASGLRGQEYVPLCEAGGPD
jgi:hypothetical protein